MAPLPPISAAHARRRAEKYHRMASDLFEDNALRGTHPPDYVKEHVTAARVALIMAAESLDAYALSHS